jgi:hypothetical protein
LTVAVVEADILIIDAERCQGKVCCVVKEEEEKEREKSIIGLGQWSFSSLLLSTENRITKKDTFEAKKTTIALIFSIFSSACLMRQNFWID